MKKEKSLALFEGKKIRRKWHKDEWWFAVMDIVSALTETINPSDYMKKVKKRDEELNKGWGQIVTPLLVQTGGGLQSKGLL